MHMTTQLPLNNRKKPSSSKSNGVFGLGNLHGGLDQVNIRDYAYKDYNVWQFYQSIRDNCVLLFPTRKTRCRYARTASPSPARPAGPFRSNGAGSVASGLRWWRLGRFAGGGGRGAWVRKCCLVPLILIRLVLLPSRTSRRGALGKSSFQNNHFHRNNFVDSIGSYRSRTRKT